MVKGELEEQLHTLTLALDAIVSSMNREASHGASWIGRGGGKKLDRLDRTEWLYVLSYPINCDFL
jgi:hypothetical protein